ncbi:MAG: hypothetical protein LIP09_15020 [Bacteroidales bacterium]|nr:hypothetical protein [Bacteroidales bacterium]
MNMTNRLITFMVLAFLGIAFGYAQDFLIYSVTGEVITMNNGKKQEAAKGQELTTRTVVDIPNGGSLQIIDLAQQKVYTLSGAKKATVSVFLKNASAPESATGKFLSFMQQQSKGVKAKGSHEQAAGTSFREDSLLIETDSLIIDKNVIME